MRRVTALVSILLLAGCEAQKPAVKTALAPRAALARTPDRPGAAARGPATQPVTTAAAVLIEEPGSTPQSLATDAAEYARVVEQQLEQRRRAEQQPRSGASNLFRAGVNDDAGEVRWLDAREFRLTLDSPIQPVHAVQINAGPAALVPPAFFDDVVTSANTAAAAPATQAAAAPQGTAAKKAELSSAPAPVPARPDELEASLARQVERNPRDVTAHLDYQLLQLLRGRQVPQLTEIGTLSKEDREVVAAVMDALVNFRSSAGSEGARTSDQRFRPLVELSERLRSSASLRIPTAALCTRVDGFGIYEPAGSRFAPGRESRVILYCEIENFVSQLNGQSFWETRLTLETTLYDAGGMRVASEERRPIIDLSRNRRRDFFARGIIRIPALPAGQYSLTVTVTDPQANRIAEVRVPVEVGS